MEMSQLRNSGVAPLLVEILSYHSNDLQLPGSKTARNSGTSVMADAAKA